MRSLSFSKCVIYSLFLEFILNPFFVLGSEKKLSDLSEVIVYYDEFPNEQRREGLNRLLEQLEMAEARNSSSLENISPVILSGAISSLNLERSKLIQQHLDVLKTIEEIIPRGEIFVSYVKKLGGSEKEELIEKLMNRGFSADSLEQLDQLLYPEHFAHRGNTFIWKDAIYKLMGSSGYSESNVKDFIDMINIQHIPGSFNDLQALEISFPRKEIWMDYSSRVLDQQGRAWWSNALLDEGFDGDTIGMLFDGKWDEAWTRYLVDVKGYNSNIVNSVLNPKHWPIDWDHSTPFRTMLSRNLRHGYNSTAARGSSIIGVSGRNLLLGGLFVGGAAMAYFYLFGEPHPESEGEQTRVMSPEEVREYRDYQDRLILAIKNELALMDEEEVKSLARPTL